MAKAHASEFPEFQSFQVPIEVFRDKDGRGVIVKGSRRVAALKALAAASRPGFTANIPVLAVEVVKLTDNQ